MKRQERARPTGRARQGRSRYEPVWNALGRRCLPGGARDLLLPGCGDPSRAHAVNEPTARDALKTALDGWKNGETPASFASASFTDDRSGLRMGLGREAPGLSAR